jgi:hypothetical protein
VPILIFIIAVLAGCLLSLFTIAKAGRDIALSKTYVIINCLLVLNAALVNFGNIQQADLMNVLVFILNWGKALNFFLIGYFLLRVSKMSDLENQSAVGYPIQKIIDYALSAITIFNGFAFIIETGYKLKNFNDLVDQFREYGYSKSFLYLIMILETLGGFGILLHFKLRTGPAAALGLMIIMLGVVYTNWHVHDPFTYSFPAVDAFMSLGLMWVLYRLERKVRLSKVPVF